MTTYLPIASPLKIASRSWENVYQYESNTLASTRRVLTQTTSRIDLNTKGFGQTCYVDLPHNVLLSNVILVFKFLKAKVVDGLYLPEGWGYNAIRRIEVNMGGTEWLPIDPKAMLVKNLADCESGAKVQDVMALAGKEFLGANSAIFSDEFIAYVNIYTPFSNMSSARCMPYDSHLLRKPVQLKIELNEASALFSKSISLSPVPTIPTGFDTAYVQVKTGILVDGPTGIAQLVGPNSNESYTYGFIYPQYDIFPGQVGKRGDKNDRQNVSLKSFRAGSVMSMDFWLTRETYGDANNNLMTDSANNSLFSWKLRNLELIYAGNSIYRADDDVDDLLNLTDYTTILAYDTSQPAYNRIQATGPYIADTKDKSRISHVQLAQFNEKFFSNLVQVGPDMVSQNVQVLFNTPTFAELKLGTGGDNPVVTVEPKFTLHVSVNYQAGVRTARGETSIVFLPPMTA